MRWKSVVIYIGIFLVGVAFGVISTTDIDEPFYFHARDDVVFTFYDWENRTPEFLAIHSERKDDVHITCFAERSAETYPKLIEYSCGSIQDRWTGHEFRYKISTINSIGKDVNPTVGGDAR